LREHDVTENAMKYTPYWWDDAPLDASPPPPLPAQADVVVVGAGYTGLSAALTLARAGRSVVVLDAGQPGFGASSRNGGMCGDRLKPSLATLSARYGRARAEALILEAREALDFLPSFLADEAISCSYVPSGSFTGTVKPAQYESLARETETLKRELGFDADMVPREEVRSEIGTDLYCGGRVSHRGGGLNPAQYHAGLMARVMAAGVIVAGESPAVAIERGGGRFSVTTPRGTIDARDVVVGTNGYTGPVTQDLRRRVIPVSSCIIATEKLSPNLMATLMPKGRMLSDSNRLLCYFRPSHDNSRVLFGGRPGYAGISPEEAALRLGRYMTTLFPDLHGVALTHSWSGNIAYTFDRLAHVGVRDGIHYAMGYCGSGVVMSTWLGRKAALRLIEHPDGRSAFAELDHPTSPFYHGRPWFLPFVQAWYQGADWLGR
jgi:glycine/D-amino acid oxidase-like deaminating enzyme